MSAALSPRHCPLLWVVLWVGFGAVAGCAPKPVEHPVSVAREPPRRAPLEAEDTLEVSGLHGTLSEDEIRATLEPKLGKFARCVQIRSSELAWLSGGMRLEFSVSARGEVLSVFPRESTLGDRASERCALQVAEGARFPRPHGGDAQFTWWFDMPIDEEVQAPTDRTASDVGEALSALREVVAHACPGEGGYTVTAYVDAGGQVISAGAATNAFALSERLDCVSEAVRAFAFPSLGADIAKVTFELP